MKIIDLTYTLDDTCMTCGTPWHEKVKLSKLGTIAEVGRNTQKIVLGSHSGTHMDAPLHFFENREGIDKADLNRICGLCSIVDMTHKKGGSVIELSDVENIKITERMLFKFEWFKNWKCDNFYKDFPYFSMEAAEYLYNKGLRVIALDTPSPDCGSAIGEKDDSPVHKFFLKNDVTIIEYLTETDKLDINKNYLLVALPLKLKDCDGSPARVIVMEDENGL